MKWVLPLFSLLLSGVLYLQWRDWSPNVPEPAPIPAVEVRAESGEVPAVGDLLVPPPPKEDYASVTERPLFLPDRRPPPDEPEEEDMPEPEEPSDLAGVDLNAVVITPRVVSAWVRGPREQESIRLRIGDDFEGWTVRTIEPDRLVLERQGETDELTLRDYANAPAPIPPTRLPVPAQVPAQQRQTPRQRRDAVPPGGAAAGSETRQPDSSPPRRLPQRQPATRRQSESTLNPGDARSIRAPAPSQSRTHATRPIR